MNTVIQLRGDNDLTMTHEEICDLAWELRDKNVTGNWNDFYVAFAQELLNRAGLVTATNQTEVLR